MIEHIVPGLCIEIDRSLDLLAGGQDRAVTIITEFGRPCKAVDASDGRLDGGLGMNGECCAVPLQSGSTIGQSDIGGIAAQVIFQRQTFHEAIVINHDISPSLDVGANSLSQSVIRLTKADLII